MLKQPLATPSQRHNRAVLEICAASAAPAAAITAAVAMLYSLFDAALVRNLYEGRS